MAKATGWKTADIMDLGYNDLLKFGTGELERIATRIQNYANKRITALEKSGMTEFSEAYNALGVGKKGVNKGRITLKGLKKEPDKKRQRMGYIREIMRAQQFVSNKTSTLKGVQEVKEQIEKRAGTTVTAEQYRQLWELVDALRKRDSALTYRVKSDEYIEQAWRIVTAPGYQGATDEQVEEYRRIVLEEERRNKEILPDMWEVMAEARRKHEEELAKQNGG